MGSSSAIVFDEVRAINPVRQNWRIRVRVVRLWTMPGKFNPDSVSSIELVLQDDKADRIHASIRSGFIARHRSSLHEGKTYVISQFGVQPTTGSYRSTDHPYRVVFQYSTSVRPCLDDGHIHRFGFCFKSFSRILNSQFDDRYLVDVIGKLTAVGSRDECVVNGIQQQRVDIELMDEELEHVVCTLWGSFAEELLQYMNHASHSPVIIIIQWCKVREFNGRRRLSNSKYTSRLLLHPSVEEVDKFVYKLTSVGVDVKQDLTHIASKPTLTLADDLLGLPDRRQIIDLRSGPSDALTIVLADIVNIRNDRGWSYTSCKQCGKKVIPDGDAFYYEKCCALVKSVLPRFMVHVEADDHTAACNFVIFDREFSKLVGLSAVQMKEKIMLLPATQSNDIGAGLPMDVVDNIVGKRYLLKVKIPNDFVRGHSNTCVILRMTADAEIINAYLAGLDDGETSDDQDIDFQPVNQDMNVLLFDSEGGTSAVVGSSENLEDDASGVSDKENHNENKLRGKKKLKIEP